MCGNIFTKYAWVKPMKDKNGKTILNGLIKIVNESNHKLNKLWVDEEKSSITVLCKKWFDQNILIYPTHNEGKAVVGESFIKTSKGKIY